VIDFSSSAPSQLTSTSPKRVKPVDLDAGVVRCAVEIRAFENTRSKNKDTITNVRSILITVLPKTPEKADLVVSFETHGMKPATFRLSYRAAVERQCGLEPRPQPAGFLGSKP
jgi:hypothetical protein